MKKLLFLVAAVATMVFTGCSKDDDASFKFGMDQIYGKWTGISVKSQGAWVDIPSNMSFSATFKSDGTYVGEGYFGNGSGTYKASGSTITTYVEGTEYARYKILSLKDGIAEMRMTIEKESIDIRCQKQ